GPGGHGDRQQHGTGRHAHPPRPPPGGGEAPQGRDTAGGGGIPRVGHAVGPRARPPRWLSGRGRSGACVRRAPVHALPAGPAGGVVRGVVVRCRRHASPRSCVTRSGAGVGGAARAAGDGRGRAAPVGGAGEWSRPPGAGQYARPRIRRHHIRATPISRMPPAPAPAEAAIRVVSSEPAAPAGRRASPSWLRTSLPLSTPFASGPREPSVGFAR